MVDHEMKQIWFDPEDPVGYTGVEKLSKRTKTNKKETEKWLKNQLAYSLNKPMRRRFPTRKYKTSGLNDLWQLDLMEMIPFASINDGYKYILTCIDVFSRFARAVPIKSKSMNDMSDAINKLIKDVVPNNIQTDLGKEFYNKRVKNIFQKQNINHYSVFSQFKAALVERFNRTLRDRLKKFFTKQGNKEWINVLPKVIKAYNHSNHRSLDGKRPIDIKDDLNIWLSRNKKHQSKKKPKYKVHDYVRISNLSASPFVKNFDQNWSDTVYQISKIDRKYNPIMYVINDENDEIVQGKFYEQELQVLPEKPNIYRIQQVLDTKGRGVHKQLLVKWHGYSEPEWIKTSQLI